MNFPRVFILLSWFAQTALAVAMISIPCYADPLDATVATSTASNPAAPVQLDGTLYQKHGDWLLFVESDKADFKKGSVQLVLSGAKKKQLKNNLIEQSYVTVVGRKSNCGSKLICVDVDSITPALYRPLDKNLSK